MSTHDSSLARALHSEADQLSLLGADLAPDELDAMRGVDGRLPVNAFRLARAKVKSGKPGRPLGAPNKRSEQLAKLVIQQYGDPVLGGASLYAMSLDQLCELLLIADGSQERAQQQGELVEELSVQVATLSKAVLGAARSGDVEAMQQTAERLADAVEGLERISKSSGKAGSLALAALNIQLTARRFVAEYVHSKRATAVDLTVKRDGVLVMPGIGDGGDELSAVQSQLAGALKSELIDVETIQRLQFRDGQVHDPEGEIEDAQFSDVAEDGDE